MAYNEHIYIQQMDYTLSDGSVKKPACVDVLKEFELWGMDVPFVIGGEAKELFSQDWLDEDGKDEYVPEIVKLQSYSMTVKFAYKGKKGGANKNIENFRNYLTGRREAGPAVFKIYSTYTGIGRQYVRFEGIEDDAELVRKDEGDILIIGVKFMVNDPITNVIYNKDTNRLQ